MLTETHTYTIPEFLVPYILGDDDSSYKTVETAIWDAFEEEEIKGWRKHHRGKLAHWHWDVGESSGFCHSHDLSPDIEACECYDLTLVLFIRERVK